MFGFSKRGWWFCNGKAKRRVAEHVAARCCSLMDGVTAWTPSISLSRVSSWASELDAALLFFSARSGGVARRWKYVRFVAGADLPWTGDFLDLEYTHGGLWLLADCECHVVAMLAGVSSTSMRRPCAELVVKLNVDSVPSGIVPGAGEDGHGLRFFFVGEPEDLIAFLHFFVSTFLQNLVPIYYFLISQPHL